jgi:hypothetical protein
MKGKMEDEGAANQGSSQIGDIREAVKAGDSVYIGEKQYYVYRMNKVFASLYAMEELETLPDEILLFEDHPPYKKKELMKNPNDIELTVKKCNVPVTEYFLEVEELKEAVICNPLNEGVIEKLGTSVQEGNPYVPELQTNSSPFYTVGDRVYLDDRQYEIRAIGNQRVWYAGIPEENGTPESPKMSWSWGRDFEMQFFGNERNQEAVLRGKQIVIAQKINMPALVEHLNHEREDIKAWEKTHPGKTVQTWLDEIAYEVKYKSFGPLGKPSKGIDFWRINLQGRNESLFYDYIDHKFMFGKTADVLRRKEQEHEGYLKRLESLADRLNEKLPNFKDSDTPNLRHYVTDLLADANQEIKGDGIFSSDSGNGVNLRCVNKSNNPFIPTILYDGNKKIFLAGTLDELEKRQKREYEEARQKKDQNAETQPPAIFYGTRQENADACWESHKLNVACARKLDHSLGEHFHNNHLDVDAVFNDIKEYGAERVSIILANTMTIRERDGRFSYRNREWGKSVVLPESTLEYGYDWAARSHSILIDAMIDKVREVERENHEKGIGIGQRVTFQPHDGKTKLTGKVLEMDENSVTLQCGRVTIPVLRKKGVFSKAAEPEKTATKEYAKEQAQNYVGENGSVFTAKGKDAIYHGAIVELTPTYAIQKVGEDAILHRLKDLEKADASLIQPGQEVSITKGGKGEVLVEPRNKEQEQGREGVSR